jgi:regulator of cell morphogenesis and NO signaling
MTFSVNDRLGDIVAQLPKAGDVFKENQIDFCCGGNRQLCEVAKEQGVDPDGLVTELNELFETVKDNMQQDVDWTKAPLDEFVDHIVNKHHAYLQTTLPALGELTTKILRVHGPNHGELSKVHRYFHQLKMEFEEHMIKEETLVFPKILEYSRTHSPELLDQAVDAIHELEEEHDSCGDLLKELHKITSGFAVPEDGCSTYHYTFQKLAEVESDTITHVHLENNILFPRLHRIQDEQIA